MQNLLRMSEFISFYSAFFALHTHSRFIYVSILSRFFPLESVREFNVNKIHNLCALDETGSCVQSTHVRGAQAACHFHIKLLQIAEVDRRREKKRTISSIHICSWQTVEQWQLDNRNNKTRFFLHFSLYLSGHRSIAPSHIRSAVCLFTYAKNIIRTMQ